MIIIIVLKPYSGVDLGPDSGHELGWSLTSVNLKIKIAIVIVLRAN